MRLVVTGILILLGVTSWAAFFLTYEKPVCLSACGCCQGGMARESEFLSFLATKLAGAMMSKEECFLIGCDIERKPIYWDLGLVGVGLVVAGIVVFAKRK